MNATNSKKTEFCMAMPVWIKDKEQEVNCCAEIECDLSHVSKESTLRITGVSFYQVLCDGKLIHFGPARKAYGFSAVDTLKLPSNTKVLTICIMGYNCPCYNGDFGSSFVCAEVECDGEIIAATGRKGFRYYENLRHIQKVVRYSRQRQFTESWDFTKQRAEAEFAQVIADVTFVERNVPYADFTEFFAKPASNVGTWKLEEENQLPIRYYVEKPVRIPAYFSQDELESHAYEEYLRMVCDYTKNMAEGSRLNQGQCRIWDFSEVQTGFFRLKLRTYGNTRIILAFDEQLDERNRPYAPAFNVINLIEWTLSEGEWDLVCFEPYVARYAELLVMEGAAELDALSILEFAYPSQGIMANTPKDEELAKIHRAAERSFRHNVLDIYMDCPSRERAGWLFDSFYTGKSEWFFTGKSTVETAFLENYINGGELKGCPGMVSMIYPGWTGGKFIPQWAMWYALEICEYITDRGGMQNREMFRESIEKLCEYFSKFENEFGLLERLDGTNFVEWSAVNDRVFDVSWATNMLYANMLELLSSVFERDDWKQKSEKLKKVICDMAFDGMMFRDRAVRDENGVLTNTDELSEVTQYYAFRFETANIDEPEYAKLKRMITEDFGPHRGDEYPNIVKADLLPGVYLRIELLLKYKMYEKLLEEIKEYFLPMAQETGTLWEHLDGHESRNHGFASYAAVAIAEALKCMEFADRD